MARVLVVPWSMAMMCAPRVLKRFLLPAARCAIVANAGAFVSREIAFRAPGQGGIKLWLRLS
jgi:hypothetical protein